jgi:hypothetical protein
MHWNKEEALASHDFDITLITPASTRNSRRQLLGDKGWKRSGVMTMFSSPYVAPDMSYKVHLKSCIAGDWSVRDRGGGIGWLEWKRSDVSAAAAASSVVDGIAFDSNAEFISIDSVVFKEAYQMESTIGAGKIRDLSLTVPYKALRLPPFITIAIRVCDKAEVSLGSQPPDVGLVFCGGEISYMVTYICLNTYF